MALDDGFFRKKNVYFYFKASSYFTSPHAVDWHQNYYEVFINDVSKIEGVAK